MSSLALADIDTPALIVDLPKLKGNIERVRQSATNAGLALRPHIKAHKTPEIAQMQIDAGAVGVTAAKVSEAEAMVDGASSMSSSRTRSWASSSSAALGRCASGRRYPWRVIALRLLAATLSTLVRWTTRWRWCWSWTSARSGVA